MSRLKVKMFSAHSIASTNCAERFYDILDRWTFTPTTFDKYEPIRQKWGCKDAFTDAWKEEGLRSFGQVLIRRSKRPAYYADASFQFGQNRIRDNKPPYHGVSIYRINESELDDANQLISIADQLFVSLKMDYGFICLEEEYEAKNIIKNYRHPDGSLEPRRVVGMNWPHCIPCLYWVNYFGASYLHQGFAQDLLRSSLASISQVGDGIRLLMNQHPRDFESEGAALEESELKTSMGQSWFFSKDRDSCTSLDVSLDELRSPIPSA
jgi:hypothetical protein